MSSISPVAFGGGLWKNLNRVVIRWFIEKTRGARRSVKLPARVSARVSANGRFFFGLAFIGKSPARPEPIELREPFFDIDVSHRLKLLN